MVRLRQRIGRRYRCAGKQISTTEYGSSRNSATNSRIVSAAGACRLTPVLSVTLTIGWPNRDPGRDYLSLTRRMTAVADLLRNSFDTRALPGSAPTLLEFRAAPRGLCRFAVVRPPGSWATAARRSFGLSCRWCYPACSGTSGGSTSTWPPLGNTGPVSIRWISCSCVARVRKGPCLPVGSGPGT